MVCFNELFLFLIVNKSGGGGGSSGKGGKGGIIESDEFCAEYAKSGGSMCKGCEEKIKKVCLFFTT